MGVAAGREDGSRGRYCSWYPGEVWRVGRRRNPYKGCMGGAATIRDTTEGGRVS